MAWFNMPMGAPNQDADLANLSGNTRTPTQAAFGRGMGLLAQANAINAQRQDDNIANLSGNTRNVGGMNVGGQQTMPFGAGLSTSQQMAMAPKVLAETPEDTMFKMRRQIEGMQYQRQANPWGQNNRGLEALRQQNRGMVGGSLQSALLDNRRNVAQRGMTADSGLAQNQDLQSRLMAAKGLSQMDTAANNDYYNRAAQFDQSQNDAANEFERWKAQALMSGDVNQAQYGLQRLGQMNEQAMMPGRLEAQGYANRDASTRLGYLPQTLQQALEAGSLSNANQRTQNEFQPQMLGNQVFGGQLANATANADLQNYYLTALARLAGGAGPGLGQLIQGIMASQGGK